MLENNRLKLYYTFEYQRGGFKPKRVPFPIRRLRIFTVKTTIVTI